MSFRTEFQKRLNAKYIVKATPQRVDYFIHDIHDPEKNRNFSNWLLEQPFELLAQHEKGELRLYDTAFIFFDKNQSVIFFYTYHPEKFNNQEAIQEDHIETFKEAKDIKIENLPLGAYCLFNILLPRFKIVIGANQHTPDGERWSKRQIEEALNKGISVYLINEHGTLYHAKTFKEVEIRTEFLWGWDEKFRKRLVILSVNPF